MLLALPTPTGPTATEMSPPSLAEFDIRLSTALRLVARITTSADWPPICRPMLTAPSV
jgi:hypothetical protein